MSNIYDRIEACLLLHAAGDTIGYKNSEWEFKRGTLTQKILGKVYEFIELGGIKNIPGDDWLVSDDTLCHLAICKSIINEKYDEQALFANIAKTFKLLYPILLKEYDIRRPGYTLMKSMKYICEGGDWNDIPYNLNDGGSGASMRTSCIGLIFHENRQKLITVALESSRMTHNSVIGYMGGITSALFTSFAINDIHINSWPFLLLDIINRGVIRDIIDKSGRGLNNYENDIHIFVDKWQKYINMKFDKRNHIITNDMHTNLIHRSRWYIDHFGNDKNYDASFYGSGGDDSVIIAYDCLLDAKDSWERLVFYAMLHGGDTDTTGCIAGSWYGAIYGMGDTPQTQLKYIEHVDDMRKYSKIIYNAYY